MREEKLVAAKAVAVHCRFLMRLGYFRGKNSNTSFSHLFVSIGDRTLASKGELPLILVESRLNKLCLGFMLRTRFFPLMSHLSNQDFVG